MVGRQDLVQLELFTHTVPAIRPLPPGHSAADHGWAAFALAVPDFDAAPARERRDDDHRAGRARGPAARGLPRPGPRRRRRGPGGGRGDAGRHPIRGLDGVRREAFVVRGGDVFLEVVRYDAPAGRPAPTDARLSDQGMMNIAVGHRERERSDVLLERVRAAGHYVRAALPPTPAGGVYATDDQGNSIEVVPQPREFDAEFGFAPQTALLCPAGWPETDVPPAQRGRP